MGYLARMVRASMLEVMGETYFRAARSLGISRPRIVYGYALRAAILPTLTLIGMGFGGLLSGAVFAEIIFARPGVGKLIFDMVMTRNFPVVQGAVLVTSVLYVNVILVADLAIAALDPRVRQSLQMVTGAVQDAAEIATAEGSIVVDGRDVGELSASEWTAFRRHLAMIFQDPVGSLSPRKTVRSLLAEPFHIHGGTDGSVESIIRRLCEMVQLPAPLLDRYPHEFSGGQARRVGVARALALEPSLVVADEPTAGLDVSVQGEILNLLAELREERGLSYLLVSHNLPAIRHICDSLAIMYLGRIVERGPCEAVFRAPAHPYTDALIRGIPRPDPAKRVLAAPIQGEIPSLINRPTGCEFRTRCPHATPRCSAEIPVERRIMEGRQVRCHHPLVGIA